MRNIKVEKRRINSLEEITELERKEIINYLSKYGAEIFVEWDELEREMKSKYDLTSPVIKDAMKKRVIELISSGIYLEWLICDNNFDKGLAKAIKENNDDRFFEGWEDSYDGLLLQRHGFKHEDFVKLFNEYGQVMFGRKDIIRE